MTIINSDESLSRFIGELREDYFKHRYLEVKVKAGTKRSLNQNALIHAWIGQIARELREDDELGWKCYIKLHYGVPILRAECDEFRESYDLVIKPLTYEQKLVAMRCWPVSSIMTKSQLGKYADCIQAEFLKKGVSLEQQINQ